MTWSAPATFVAGSVFTAAFFNQQVRDNLLETMPGKASGVPQLFVSNGSGLSAQQVVADYVATSESTTSSTYGDLTTTGPRVTANTQTQALVFLYAAMVASVSTTSTFMAVQVDPGASTIAAADSRSIAARDTAGVRTGGVVLVTGLTPGLNVFIAKYRSGNNTVSTTYSDRRMVVVPL